jgi:hypothetical protein
MPTDHPVGCRTYLATIIVSSTFVQNAVDLCPMFLNRADPHARNGEKLAGGGGTLGRESPQGLVGEDAECRDTASFCSGDTGSQFRKDRVPARMRQVVEFITRTNGPSLMLHLRLVTRKKRALVVRNFVPVFVRVLL